MFQLKRFQEVSSFYEEGRTNLEDKLRRVLSLDEAKGILRNNDHYGHYGFFRPKTSPDDLGERTRIVLERMSMTRYGVLYSFLEWINPLKTLVDAYGPKLYRDPQFLGLPDSLTDSWKRNFEHVVWGPLRHLHDGWVEQGFKESDDSERNIMVKDGRRYNLGYHYYRVRRTTEPQGTLLQVGLPELREFGEARPLFVERNQTALTAGLYLTFGVAGGIVASIVPSYFPENTDPILYIADSLIGLGSIAGVVQGIRTIRQNRSKE